MPDPGMPCKDCTDRVLHCHSFCERYRAFRAAIEQNTRERTERNDEINFAYALKREVRRRYNKRRKGDK
jgi:hypothetical protein